MKRVFGWLVLLALAGGFIWLTMIRTVFTDPVTEEIPLGDFSLADDDSPQVELDGPFYGTWTMELYPTGEVGKNGAWKCLLDVDAGDSYKGLSKLHAFKLTFYEIPGRVTVTMSRAGDGSASPAGKNDVCVLIQGDENIYGHSRRYIGNYHSDMTYWICGEGCRAENVVFTRGGSYSMTPNKWGNVRLLGHILGAALFLLIYLVVLVRVKRLHGRARGGSLYTLWMLVFDIAAVMALSAVFPGVRDFIAGRIFDGVWDFHWLAAAFTDVCGHTLAVCAVSCAAALIAVIRIIGLYHKAQRKGGRLAVLLLLYPISVALGLVGAGFAALLACAVVLAMFHIVKGAVLLVAILFAALVFPFVNIEHGYGDRSWEIWERILDWI